MNVVCICVDDTRPGGVCTNPATKVIQVEGQQIPVCDKHHPDEATYSELNQQQET